MQTSDPDPRAESGRISSVFARTLTLAISTYQAFGIRRGSRAGNFGATSLVWDFGPCDSRTMRVVWALYGAAVQTICVCVQDAIGPRSLLGIGISSLEAERPWSDLDPWES